MIGFVHNCGGFAFFTDHVLEVGEVIQAEMVTLLEGDHPSNGDAMLCGSCGGFVYPDLTEQMDVGDLCYLTESDKTSES